MACLFVHDFRSYIKEGNVYTTNLSYEILKKRYVDCFGELNILNRCGQMGSSQSERDLVKASGTSIKFVNEIGIFTPISFCKNYFKIKKIVYKYASNSEYIIIRLDSFLGLIAAKYCRKHSKKYLIEVVGCVRDSFWNKGLFGKVVAFPLFGRMRYEIKYAPYVVYVTKKFLQRRYPTKGETTNVSNVLLNKHSETTINSRLDKIKEIQNKKYTFQLCTVAAVNVKYKGQQFVLKAMARLKKSGNLNFSYHLVGPGDPKFLKEITQKYELEDYVIFHGSLAHNKVIELLDEMDVYIQPSFQEGLPRAVIEAMSRGLLCIGSDVAGIPELLDENWIFKRRKNVPKQIEDLLLKIDSDTMKGQAKRNFNEAKKYETDLLEQRRRSFFEKFLNENELKV
ncbi:MAG: glycosyltransferase family 4 protein [Clostridium sp.]|nr:glycosyltransferase family 4 protein [Clostridium sp.]